MHKNATKCNKTQSKWCINKHGASKIIDTWNSGVDVRSGEIPAFAGDSDTRGCHLPPWRYRHSFDYSSPHRAPGETLCLAVGSSSGDITMSLPSWRCRFGCSCSPSNGGWSRCLPPTQSVSLQSIIYTVVKVLRQCLSGLVGSCCLLANSSWRLWVWSMLIWWLLESGLASVISIFRRDTVLRLCASPLAIPGGWRCKAGLCCLVVLYFTK
jgi:hypothetical protein